MFRIGSLFSGSGGFELAGIPCGIEPVWAAEVEPYPVAVTRSRFPSMKHYGDVSKINGAEVDPVDIITFGAPCQDLSVAGKRKGLRHEDLGDEETTRSGLFWEAVRIIKEMREATNGRYPAFAVYENVPGAFSSSSGEDWRTVLQSLIQIVEPGAVVPDVPQGGWAYADWIMGEGWSLAYRILDAQYWGVPQRRRRVYLVLDLRGDSAGKILFEREGLRGYFAEGGTPWQAAAGDAEAGVGADDRAGESGVIPNLLLDDQGGQQINVRTDGKAPTLRAEAHGNVPAVVYSVENHPADSRVNIDDSGKVQTLTSRMGTGGGNVPMVMEPVVFRKGTRPHSVDEAQKWEEADVANTLNTFDQGESRASELVVEAQGVDLYNQALTGSVSKTLNAVRSDADHTPCVIVSQGINGDVAGTLDASYYKGCGMRQGTEREVVAVPVYSLQGNTIDRDAKQNGSGVCEGTAHTLNAVDRHGVVYAMQGFGDYKQSEVASGLKARDWKDATDLVAEEQPIALDRAFFNQGQNALYDPQFYTDGTVPTLVARGPSAVAVRYIVRRLTPTECARLQGFPDKWGHPDHKDSFTDEEWAFWQEVRNTHATINGKPVKEYTREQMLKWYNGLHTDSAEYKMWGNGIALPCALYVMQGIEDALKERALYEQD